MFDQNQLMKIIQGVQANPQFLDRAAESLAMNPGMAPPPPGSLSQAMQAAMSGVAPGGPQLGPGGLTPPAPQGVPGATPPPPATPPITPGTQVANQGGPAGLPAGVSLGDILAGSQGGQPQPPQGQLDPQQMANAMRALQGPEQHKEPSYPSQPYIGNLNFGAAKLAQGLQMPGRQAPRVGGLGQYL